MTDKKQISARDGASIGLDFGNIHLGGTRARICDTLVNYILSSEADRHISFCIEKDGRTIQKQVSFQKNLGPKTKEDTHTFLQNWVSAAVSYGGTIIARFSGLGQDGKDLINGLQCRNGRVLKIPVATLREMSVPMPDGSCSADSTADYQLPAVILG